MAYFLEKAFEEYSAPYIYLSHHSGFAKDSFTNPADEAVTYVFGGYENEYNPAIMYNRAIFEGENTIVQGVRDMSPTPYLEALAIAADMPALAAVDIRETDDGICVSGRVARDLVATPLYLSCYLVEDGIKTDNYPQQGMDDDDAPADLKDVFRHNGVILHHFTEDAGGDLLQVAADGTYSVAYPTVQKTGFGGTGRRYVALVHKVDKNNLRENQALNAAQLSLNKTGITTPRSQRTSTTLFDLSGRPVAPDNMKSGLYILNGQKVIR